MASIAVCSPAMARWRGTGPCWLAASVVGFVLWALPTSLMLDGRQAPLMVQAGAAFWLRAGVRASGCLSCWRSAFVLPRERTRILDSLSVNAYSMYLCITSSSVWLQYALLPLALFAVGKAAIVFSGTLALSWAAAVMPRQRAVGHSPRPGQAVDARELRRSRDGQVDQAGRFDWVTFPGQTRAG